MGDANRILVVDDDVDILDLLSVLLSNAGYEVLIARNGSEALSVMKHTLPVVIISDIMMPSVNGYEFLNEVRRTPRLKLIPFIFLSSMYSISEINLGLSLGADYYLPKPVNRTMLLERVSRVFDLLRKTEQLSQYTKPTMKGNLRYLSVQEIFQIMEIGLKSGMVNLHGENIEAQVAIGEGHPLNARMTYRGQKLAGEEAIFAMLSMKDGLFEIEFGKPKVEARINQSFGTMLLKWSVQQDSDQRPVSDRRQDSAKVYSKTVTEGE